eukprot:9850-Chlamydomonas_euryale.AAC.2
MRGRLPPSTPRLCQARQGGNFRGVEGGSCGGDGECGSHCVEVAHFVGVGGRSIPQNGRRACMHFNTADRHIPPA